MKRRVYSQITLKFEFRLVMIDLPVERVLNPKRGYSIGVMYGGVCSRRSFPLQERKDNAMSKEIQVFQNEQFGRIRSVSINGEPWLAGKDVASALGYSNTKDALASHVDDEDKRIIQRSEIATLENHIPKTALNVEFVTAEVPNRGLTIINESGLYSLILSSKLPAAKAFKHWVTSEVLPSIRKHGVYELDKAKQARLETMERNSRAREASLWLKIAKTVKSDTYQQICASYASKTLAGREVIPLPKSTQRHYTATEIGAMFSVSARRVGMVANENNMKTEEYGEWFHDKSPFSAREVDTFRYNDNAVDRFKELFE